METTITKFLNQFKNDSQKSFSIIVIRKDNSMEKIRDEDSYTISTQDDILFLNSKTKFRQFRMKWENIKNCEIDLDTLYIKYEDKEENNENDTNNKIYEFYIK